jgi:hypothetical protein
MIFVLLPTQDEFSDVYEAISDAVRGVDEAIDHEISIGRAFQIRSSPDYIESLQLILNETSLVVADVSNEDPNIAYLLGVVEELGKPILIISQNESPFFFRWRGPSLLYERQRLSSSLVPRLTRAIAAVLNEPEQYERARKQEKSDSRPSVFVSYNHADIEALRRLQVHLKPLQKKGEIELWADTEIKAGDKWRDQIAEALDRAAIAVLLISPDFLASDFIVDNELPPLLQAAEQKGTVILPVILKPSRFLRDENLSPFQAINPPSRPLLSLPPIEQDRIWDEVAQAIESKISGSV